MDKIFKSRPVIEGAGVRLQRVFSNEEAQMTDPFLLLDHFGSEDPADYLRGFPWHPHRGIETVTYMLKGEVEHGDSLGNKGVIKSGDIQWMTAGSGIIHQEMPKTYKGLMQGFQLWVNLPRDSKMMHPRYQGILAKEIPVVKKDGLEVKVIAGEYNNQKGPVKDLVVDIDYFDIALEKGREFKIPMKKGYTTFGYLYSGSGSFNGNMLEENQIVLLDYKNHLEIKASEKMRFILVSGKPLKEPIAWGGPIVMNTKKELETAFRELDDGTFIKK